MSVGVTYMPFKVAAMAASSGYFKRLPPLFVDCKEIIIRDLYMGSSYERAFSEFACYSAIAASSTRYRH